MLLHSPSSPNRKNFLYVHPETLYKQRNIDGLHRYINNNFERLVNHKVYVRAVFLEKLLTGALMTVQRQAEALRYFKYDRAQSKRFQKSVAMLKRSSN